MYDLKVIIIGAGIGGLTAGIALQQAGYQVEIYDRIREMRPVGAGISLWSNGVKVLNRLGLGKQIAHVGGHMNWMEYRTLDGNLLNQIPLFPLIDAVGQRPYPVARRDLQNLLVNAFTGKIHLDHTCIGVEQDETGVTALFENGHRARGDLLIAADGVRSNLRTYVLGKEFAPHYAGYINWNGLVTAEVDLAPPDTWVIYVGEHKRAALMPVAGERYYFFFDVPLPVDSPHVPPEQYQSELKEYFTGWAKPVQLLIDRIDPFATARPRIHDVGPIERMVRGRVALLGDAAHATCPDLGQGGAQAMEDGWVLMNCLLSTNISVEDALQRYERERKDRTDMVVQKARKRAEMIHGKDPVVTQRWYEQLGKEPPSSVTDSIATVILGGPLR
ncbi:MAG: FAD-dependent urate hydroxylase HpxO [Leptolyngbyaceae cyanobacterium bins.59]|nr:FAD-dependent urate hydroxylase HpxO [Leptolyngbyaceae cyanobacterium bins.59]